MMIKVFTKNENGKVELAVDELKKLLDEAYWEGYKNNTSLWTYNSPNIVKTSPYEITCSEDPQVAIKFDASVYDDLANNYINRIINSVDIRPIH